MTDGDQQDPNGELAKAEQHDPPSEIAEVGPQHPPASVADANQQYPFGATIDEVPQPLPKAPAKPGLNRIYIMAAITVGAGILVGFTFAASAGLLGGSTGLYDLGSAASSAEGLKGHLFTEWDNKLRYRLTIEPSDQDGRAGFARAVSNPPRPVSFDILVKDPMGFVLCSKNVVLRYDPAKAATLAPADQKPPTGKANPANVPLNQTAQGAYIAQSQAQEQERERDKEVFRNDLSPDGQIESISSQGDMPCSKKAYESAASWSFSANFPTLAEQADLLKGSTETQADAARLSRQAAAVLKKAKRRAAENPMHFSVEGYDVISWADASGEVISTEGGKAFVIDKKGGPGHQAGWQVYPASIHYRCDEKANCIITRADSVSVLYARLRK
jgi:hypothetical protein